MSNPDGSPSPGPGYYGLGFLWSVLSGFFFAIGFVLACAAIYKLFGVTAHLG